MAKIKNMQNYGMLRVGTVYKQRDKIRCASEDYSFYTNEMVQVLGHAKRVTIPGLDASMPAYVFRGYLYVGCQRIPIVRAFKALAKLAGYEVTG